jgi:hypothetical protein
LQETFSSLPAWIVAILFIEVVLIIWGIIVVSA